MAGSITTRRRCASVTSLEHRYPEFDGLNLTWESLEGIVKHNGPMTARDGTAIERYCKRGIPYGISDYLATHDWRSGALPRWRPRLPPSATISPTMPTTSTTACEPAFSASMT